jgi:hypothetical protein
LRLRQGWLFPALRIMVLVLAIYETEESLGISVRHGLN